jgi:membrane-associated protease RseP (regulator of RpoE activity)
MTRRAILIAALVAAAAALHPGHASAQGSTALPRGAEQMPDGSVRMSRRPGPSIGIAYTGNPVVGEDGQIRFAEHPVVTGVEPNSSAARAGILPGDVLLAVNGRDARERGLFGQRVYGTRYTLRIRRGTEERDIAFVFEPAPTAPAPAPAPRR